MLSAVEITPKAGFFHQLSRPGLGMAGAGNCARQVVSHIAGLRPRLASHTLLPHTVAMSPVITNVPWGGGQNRAPITEQLALAHNLFLSKEGPDPSLPLPANFSNEDTTYHII